MDEIKYEDKLKALEIDLKELRRKYKNTRKTSYEDGVIQGITISLKRLEEISGKESQE